MRYGIIGVGAMGREHAENLRFIDGATVTALSDPDEGSRSLATKQLGSEVKVFTDHNQLLDSGLVDANASAKVAPTFVPSRKAASTFISL
ncbi:MAG: hypothetical protein EB069_09135 [Actinobacteria bacterium]|nr:hypothetical protein [Actinomycetota bacterium]